MIKLKVIGLCGGSGVGKGYVGKMFAALGFSVIDTDAVYHRILSEGGDCVNELRREFGDGIMQGASLDRKELAKIVFSDAEKHRVLNTITHKHILSDVRATIRELSRKGERAVIVDAPMLFESGFDKECDITLGVVADENIRIDRIVNRDGITRERALARISNQLSTSQIVEKCDFVITNNGSDEELRSEFGQFINKFLN